MLSKARVLLSLSVQICVGMNQDKSKINDSFANTPPPAEKMKEPTCDRCLSCCLIQYRKGHESAVMGVV